MRAVVHEFNSEQISILPIGDLHIGAEGSRFQEALKLIEKHKDAKLLFLGDLVNNSLTHSVGDIYSELENPQSQLHYVKELFYNNKDRILGVVLGNHERRSWRQVGLDPTAMLCELFGIPYAEDILLVDVSLKFEQKRLRGSKRRTNYIIAITHGAAGGRFPEKSARQHRYFKDMFFGDVDIFITGHTHVPTFTKLSGYIYDKRNKVISQHDIYNITIPAWLNERYAREHLLPPTPQGMFLINLYAKSEKTIEILSV